MSRKRGRYTKFDSDFEPEPWYTDGEDDNFPMEVDNPGHHLNVQESEGNSNNSNNFITVQADDQHEEEEEQEEEEEDEDDIEDDPFDDGDDLQDVNDDRRGSDEVGLDEHPIPVNNSNSSSISYREDNDDPDTYHADDEEDMDELEGGASQDPYDEAEDAGDPDVVEGWNIQVDEGEYHEDSDDILDPDDVEDDVFYDALEGPAVQNLDDIEHDLFDDELEAADEAADEDLDNDQSDSEQDLENLPDIDDYEIIFHHLCKEWLKVEANHKVSKVATDAFWSLGKEWFHRMFVAKNQQRVKKKTPCFPHIRRTLDKKYVPPIKMSIAYKHNESGEVTVVEDTLVTPRNRFPSNQYKKMWEIAHVQVNF